MLLTPLPSYFLHSSFYFILFYLGGGGEGGGEGGKQLQIVLFVFITKSQNKTLIIQFVQKVIKRPNVFLLLAEWLCLVWGNTSCNAHLCRRLNLVSVVCN